MKRFDIAGHARFETFSCYRRMALLGDPLSRDAFVEHLEVQRERLGFDVIAWVVMPEHVHLVVVPVDGEMGVVLRGLKQVFSRSILARWRERDAAILESLVDPRGMVRFWQRGGGYDRNVRDLDELREKVNYIHMNPVRRGLVEFPEEWKWSSVRDYSGVDGVVEIRRRW